MTSEVCYLKLKFASDKIFEHILRGNKTYTVFYFLNTGSRINVLMVIFVMFVALQNTKAFCFPVINNGVMALI